jgi:hypothetical protein
MKSVDEQRQAILRDAPPFDDRTRLLLYDLLTLITQALRADDIAQERTLQTRLQQRQHEREQEAEKTPTPAT